MRNELALRGALLGALLAGAAFAVGAVVAGDDTGTVVLVAAGCVVAGLALGYAAFIGPGRAVLAVSRAAARLARSSDLRERVEVVAGAAPDLVHSFNRMAGQLQAVFDNLTAEHTRLEAVF